MYAATRTCTRLVPHVADTRVLRFGSVASILSAIVVLAGCGGSTTTQAAQSKPVDESTLVGTWGGSVDGGSDPNSYGFSVVSFSLKADSTITTTAENPKYCVVAGRWTVAAAQWTAVGSDCGGTVVTFTAPLSSTRLAGSWKATSGRTGSFSVAKLP